MTYEEKLASFENSCHLYRKEIVEVERLKHETLNPLQQKRLSLMEADIQFVDDTFERIKEECGRHARLIMWCIMIEEKKGDDVADHFEISRATLSNWIKQWRSKIFGGGVLIFSSFFFFSENHLEKIICRILIRIKEHFWTPACCIRVKSGNMSI